jgi:ubiquinone/menaquinone biosynthesis C-methylase UbiE
MKSAPKLHSYLLKYVDSLDTVHYRVHLKKDLDYSANHSFRDGDYWSTTWFADYWRRLFWAKMRHVGLAAAPDGPVLDCCCGQGFLGQLFEVAFHIQPIYCDLSVLQLRDLVLRRQIARSSTPITCAADVLYLPYAPESFACIVGNSFLHHVPDVPAVLGELHRVLRPRGTVIFFHEPTTTASFWESFPLSVFKDTSPTDITGSFADLWLFEPDDLARLMRNAGFENVHILTSGILSALCLNWYLTLALRFNWRSRVGVYPAYVMRVWLTALDLRLQRVCKSSGSPSVMVLATKPEHRAT